MDTGKSRNCRGDIKRYDGGIALADDAQIPDGSRRALRKFWPMISGRIRLDIAAWYVKAFGNECSPSTSIKSLQHS